MLRFERERFTCWIRHSAFVTKNHAATNWSFLLQGERLLAGDQWQARLREHLHR